MSCTINRRVIPALLAILLGMLQVGVLAAEQRPGAPVDPFAPPEESRPPSERRRPARSAPQAGTGDRANPPAKSARERIETELERTTDLEVVEMPLKDVMIYLQEKHEIPIVLNLKKLEEASISADAPVTKSLRNIRLAAALDLMLEDLELAYYAGEVLAITTPEDAATRTEVRVFDCRDLLARQGEGGIEPARVSRLMEIIQGNVRPETWRGYASDVSPAAQPGRRTKPSPAGSISEFDGLLIVTQTERVHRKVEHLLNTLRQAAGLEQRMGRLVR
jgi:hypothetical protein